MSATRDPKYSIVVTHLNMIETVERSLRSILSQIDETYEVLLVDGGSRDGSLSVIRALSDEYDALRVIVTERTASPETLGADRNVGVREAAGDHVLLQLDADDEFAPVIQDFVSIYERLRAATDRDFYLSGSGMNVAPKSFLLSYGPYRDRIHRAEDADMWRRLLSDDALLHIDHEPVCESLGYDQSGRTFVRDRFSEVRGDLRSGVTVRSRMAQAIFDQEPKVAALECLLTPIAALTLVGAKRYELPPPYDDARVLGKHLDTVTRTVRELEEEYEDFSMNPAELSDAGRRVFYDDSAAETH